MRIAVASIDGSSIAPTLTSARYLLVFPVDGEVIGNPELRPLFDEEDSDTNSWQNETSAFSPHPLSSRPRGARDLIVFPTPTPPVEAPQTSIPEAVKEEMLDCEILLAGMFSAEQQREGAKLGTLALKVPTDQDAQQTIRWVVNGGHAHVDADCGDCATASA